MVALLIFLAVLAVSFLVTRVATRLFMLTGLSQETARFQARSIITGTGFTTDEAAHIVDHPVRRRIALTLMLVGNAGLVTAVSTFILSFMSTGTATEALQRGVVFAAGIGVLAFLAFSQWIDRYLTRLIEAILTRVTSIQVRDMYTLLNLGDGYTVSRVEVAPASWLAGDTLRSLHLPTQGLLVLTIEHPDGTVDYAPGANDCVPAGGRLTVYGPQDRIVDFCAEASCGPDETPQPVRVPESE